VFSASKIELRKSFLANTLRRLAVAFNPFRVKNIFPAARVSGDCDCSTFAKVAPHSKFSWFHAMATGATVHIEVSSIFLSSYNQVFFWYFLVMVNYALMYVFIYI